MLSSFRSHLGLGHRVTAVQPGFPRGCWCVPEPAADVQSGFRIFSVFLHSFTHAVVVITGHSHQAQVV